MTMLKCILLVANIAMTLLQLRALPGVMHLLSTEPGNMLCWIYIFTTVLQWTAIYLIYKQTWTSTSMILGLFFFLSGLGEAYGVMDWIMKSRSIAFDQADLGLGLVLRGDLIRRRMYAMVVYNGCKAIVMIPTACYILICGATVSKKQDPQQPA